MARRLALVVAVVLGAAALVLALAGETVHVDGRAVACGGPLVRVQTGPDPTPYASTFQRHAGQACVGADRTAFFQAAALLVLAVGIGLGRQNSTRGTSVEPAGAS